jgi:hypothetical protein
MKKTKEKQSKFTISVKDEKLYKKICEYKINEKANLSDIFCKRMKAILAKK